MLSLASQVKTQKITNNCEGYLFFDGVHPTTLAHVVIAQQAKAYLDAEGLEFGA